MLISIIVPAFNESKSLVELFERVYNTLNSQGQHFEFIIIDDGSVDDTFEKLILLNKNYQNITVLRHFRNYGKSLALMQGFNEAKGDIAITLDADLQDDPELINHFLNKLEEGYDFVNGWRKNRKDTFLKCYVSKIFNLFTSYIFKCNVHDINCGFKAYKKKVYKNLILWGDLHRLIPAIVCAKGFKVSEIPVSHNNRKYGKSKYKLLRYRGLLDIIALAASNTTQLRPFHIFCELAFFFWFLAFIAFIIWIFLIVYFPIHSVIGRILSTIIIFLGGWFVLIGTIFPLFGFYLDILSRRFQNNTWRNSLIKEKLNSKKK